jgi:hypothetical protein
MVYEKFLFTINETLLFDTKPVAESNEFIPKMREDW